jgi:hypothetical protein
MKYLSKYTLLFCMLIVLLFGCKKDLEQVVMKTGQAPVVNLSSTSLALSAANSADTAFTISWSATDYGFKAAISYSVQIAKAGTNFANPLEVTTGTKRLLKYTVGELNQIALIRGLAPASAGQLEIRVKSTLTDALVLYSEKATLTLTPYLVIINYPSLWVPGAYQGWAPATAPKLSSRLSNGIYEGYVNITGSDLNFKYTPAPNWENSYGWASSTVTGNDVSGTFNTTGGNLFVPTAGYYLLKGNTNDNTWSATKITGWGIIGDFNGWSTDVNMTYDTNTKLWTATINPSSNGVFKFRANGAWSINLGDKGADLILDYDGDNIPVTAGTKTITLDLSVPGNYTYKIQ